MLVFNGDRRRRHEHRRRAVLRRASREDTWRRCRARKGPAAVILGAGGAARAIVLALQRAGRPGDPYHQSDAGARSETLGALRGGAISVRTLGRLEGGLCRRRAARQHDEPRHDRKAAARDRARSSAAITPRSPTSSTTRSKPICLRAAKARGHRDDGWPRHADASGRAGLRRVVRRHAQGHAGAAAPSSKGAPWLRRPPFASVSPARSAWARARPAKLFARLGLPVLRCRRDRPRALWPGRAWPSRDRGARSPKRSTTARVDRAAWPAIVVGDAAALRALEALVHPLVREAEDRFIDAARARNEELVDPRHPAPVRNRARPRHGRDRRRLGARSCSARARAEARPA